MTTLTRFLLLIMLGGLPLGAVEPLLGPQPSPIAGPIPDLPPDYPFTFQVTTTASEPVTMVVGTYANNSGSQRLTGFRHIPDPYGRSLYDQFVPMYAFTPSELSFVPSAMYTPDISTTCLGSIWGIGTNTILNFMLNGTSLPLQCTQTMSLPFGEQAELVITYETEDLHVVAAERYTGIVVSTMDVKGVLKRGTVPVPTWRNRTIINRIGEDGLPVNPFHNTTMGGMLPPPPGPLWSSG